MSMFNRGGIVLMRGETFTPATVALADEATAFIGDIDLARGRNLQRLLDYRDRLAGNVARDTAAIEALDEQIARERAAMPPEQAADDVLTELAEIIDADFAVAAE